MSDISPETIEAAAKRLISCNGELAWKEQYEGDVRHDFGDDVDDVAKWCFARLAADRAEQARHSLQSRCDGNGSDWLLDGDMVVSRIAPGSRLMEALASLGVERRGGE
jgi:hypothetical protein